MRWEPCAGDDIDVCPSQSRRRLPNRWPATRGQAPQRLTARFVYGWERRVTSLP